jgi:hypothetical protein
MTAKTAKTVLPKSQRGQVVWLILFYDSNAPPTSKAEKLKTAWVKIAEKYSMVLKVAAYDCGRGAALCEKYRVVRAPAVFILHPEGAEEYSGKMSSSEIVKAATAKIKDTNVAYLGTQAEVDAFLASSNNGQRAFVVLFSDAPKASPLYRAVSNDATLQKRVKFGMAPIGAGGAGLFGAAIDSRSGKRPVPSQVSASMKKYAGANSAPEMVSWIREISAKRASPKRDEL